MLGTYHLNALFEILNRLHFVYEPQKLWEYILEQAAKTLQSEAGSFLEISPDEQELTLKAAYGISYDRLNRVPFRVGSGISGWVAQYHQPALVNDVREDNRFNRQVDILTGFTTRSILCTPIFSMKKTYGVLQIINRRNGTFNPQDQEFMTLLGRQAAVAYQNLLLLTEVRQKETLLQSLLDNLSGGLIAMDQSGHITIVNPSAIQLLHLGAEAKVGAVAESVLKDYPWFLQILKETLAQRNTVSRQETRLSIENQEQRIGYTTILIADHDRQVLGSGIIFQRLAS